MEEFCGSPFWDSNVTWYTDSPDFTPCFQATVLAWSACAFLWIAGILEMFYLISLKSTIPNSASFLNISERSITMCLTGIEIFNFIYSFRSSRSSELNVYPVDRVSPAIRSLSFVFALFLQNLNARKGVASSGVLFLFWLFEVFLGAFRFQSAIRQELAPAEDEFKNVRSTMLFVSFPLCVIQLFLHFFADASPKQVRVESKPSPSESPVKLQDPSPCPERVSSFPSRITFQWIWPLAVLGYKKPLEFTDLWDLNPEDKSDVIVGRFQKFWKQAIDTSNKVSAKKGSSSLRSTDEMSPGPQRRKLSILPVLLKCNRLGLVVAAAAKVISDLQQLASPQILDLLISHVESGEETWKGYFFAALLFLNVAVQVSIQGQYFRNNFVTGMRVRTALIGAIYQKSLLLSNASRKDSTVGEIVNLMSVDTQKLADSPMFLNVAWSAPIIITLSMCLLWITLGPSVLAGAAILIALIPTNVLIMRRVKRLQILQMKLKDRRVKLMSEILSGMRVLKLYAWEPYFEKQVGDIRRKEMEILRTQAILKSLSSFTWFITPFLVSLVTFGTYVLIDDKNVLDAKKAFVSLTYFNILRMPLQLLPHALTSLIQASASLKRVNFFMNSEEIEHSSVTHEKDKDGSCISVENGNFAWGATVTLKNINLKIPTGSLVAVIGPVGSGKSSLLSAILGEMDKLCGSVNTFGTTAYVAQQAWIQNATLRDNILFGKKFEKDAYDAVLDACALRPDLKILSGGDMTEIGEMGINLSGGQKQRVALARAAYNNADIYLLDDPLSAVDSHVGKELFDKVIGPNGLLKSKTRLMVTHSVTYLSQVDDIAIMSDGEIVEFGTFRELLEKKGTFAGFVAQHGNSSEDVEQMVVLNSSLASSFTPVNSPDESAAKNVPVETLTRRTSSSSSSAPAQDPRLEDKLITVEKAQTGNVKGNVYKYYMQSFSTHKAVVALMLYLILHGLNFSSSIWLGEWANAASVNATLDTTKRNLYLGVYGGFGLGQAVSSFMGNMVLALGCLHAAGTLHNVMIMRVMRAPMSFFDTTPLGRIVNRFSKDIDVLDSNISGNLHSFITYLFQVMSTLIVISYSVPLFLAVVVPISVMYYVAQRFYVTSSRQLKRLESVTRSPIYSHFSETLQGTTTIRAFGVQKEFIVESERTVDRNQMTYYPSIIANRWVGYNLETLGNLVVLFAALLAVISGRDESSLGLSVSYALTLTQTLKWLVRLSADVEMDVVAVERVMEYGKVPQEAEWSIPHKSPPEDWPSSGLVKFQNYQTRYREGLDLVLRCITCRINPGEKVGIVGRTGAGKSSLTLGLFRIIEATGGSIEIDGRVLADLGLHDVRGRLTIIPQDPVLFAGPLRMNLDPAGSCSDNDLWRALHYAHLDAFAKALPKGLDYEIFEGGGNLSVGQRQLVCLARALLRKTKILILDEATAAVDLETDDLIQKTIRSEFKDCTVITIAHRLNTIMDYDRVMVLDKGEIKEFSSPEDLLSKPESVFLSMAKDAGLA